jgi:hypothetical protein
MGIGTMLRIKTLSDCRRRGFEGSVDADLDISLYEYGLIHKEEKDGRYLFIYGVDTELDSENHRTFDYAHFDEDDFKDVVSGSWFSLSAVLNCVGMPEDRWRAMPLPNRVYDLMCFYGRECVFGSSGVPFEISTRRKQSSTV